MTTREACGGDCGGGCGHNHEQDSTEMVWHNPPGYDQVQNGPPYLPGQKYASVKVSSADRARVREWLQRQAAYYDTGPNAMTGSPMQPLSSFLAIIRAVSMIHQEHHWQTRGGDFYGDHLLFMRLYDESQTFIDQVAERAVGSGGPQLVDVRAQVAMMHRVIDSLAGDEDPEAMVRVSMQAETMLLGALKQCIDMLEATGSLTHGTSNLLEGLGDVHETFTYLLGQRLGGRTASTKSYKYDRR